MTEQKCGGCVLIQELAALLQKYTEGEAEPEQPPLEGMQAVYQKLYDQTDYGKADANACPGVRFLPMYRHYIEAPVIDLGCGTGDTVFALREAGIYAEGIDWIDAAPEMGIADITKPQNLSAFKTALCLDVLEHIPEDKLQAVFDNLAQCEKQVVSTHSGPSNWQGGPELHITQYPPGKWRKLLEARFEIVKAMSVGNAQRWLFLMRRK